jgi:hypothetical protein
MAHLDLNHITLSILRTHPKHVAAIGDLHVVNEPGGLGPSLSTT